MYKFSYIRDKREYQCNGLLETMVLINTLMCYQKNVFQITISRRKDTLLAVGA